MARAKRKLIVLVLAVGLGIAVVSVPIYFLLRAESDPTPYVVEGQQLMADAKYAEALLPLGRAHRIARGQRADILAMIGECYLKMKPEPDYGKAMAYYRRAKQVSAADAPERVTYTESLRDLFRDRGVLSEALVEAEDLTRMRPDNDAYWRELARLCAGSVQRETAAGERQALMARAFEAVDTAIEKGPAELDNYLMKQQLVLFKDDADAFEQAEAIVKEAVGKADRKADALVALGDMYRRRAEQVIDRPAERKRWLDQASKAYNDALGADADCLAALAGLGQLAVYEEDYVQAESYFRQVKEKSPKDDRGYWYLARLLRARNDADGALGTVMEAFAECKPIEELTERQEIGYRFQNLSVAADILVDQGKTGEAEQYVEQMRQLAPNRPIVSHLSGKIAFRENDLPEAYDLFTKAVQMQEAEASRAVTATERRRAQWEEGEYRFSLGAVCSSLNLSGKAVEELDRALVLLEGGNPLLRLQIRRERARLYLTLRDYAKSEAEAREVLRALPTDFATLFVLSRALVLQDKAAEALPIARTCTEVAPDRYEGYVALALIHKEENRVPEAEKALLDGIDKATDRLPLYESLIGLYLQDETLKAKLPALVDRAQNDDTLSDAQKFRVRYRVAPTQEDRLKMVTDELDKDPENTSKMMAVAQMLIQVDERDKALEYLKRAYGLALASGDMAQVRRLWDIVWVLLITSEDPQEAREWIDRMPAELAQERRIADGLYELISAASLPPGEAEGKSPVEVTRVKNVHADKAIQMFQRLLGEQKGPPDVRLLRAMARAHFLKGSLAPQEQKDQFAEAVKYHTQILSLVPQDIQSRISLASIYRSLFEPEKALAQLAEVLSRDPTNITALNLKADALWDTGEHARAIEARAEIRRLAPDNVPNLMRMGALHEFLDDKDSAVAVYRSAAELAPRAADVILPLARMLYWKGQATRQEADDLVDKLSADMEAEADKAPDEANRRAGKTAALLLRAQHFKDTGRPDQAIAMVQQALAADPTNRTAVLFASALMSEAGRYEQARTVCDAYLETSPDDIAVTTQLCDVLMTSGADLDRAERLLTDVVLKEVPMFLRAQTILARIWARMATEAQADGNADRARELSDKAAQKLDEVLRDSPDFGEALFSRAELHYTRGDKRQAINVLGRVRRNDPVYGRAMLRRAQINMEQGQQPQARSDLLNLLRVNPRDLQARLGLAELYQRGNMMAEAEQVLKDGFRYMLDHPALMESLIGVLLKQAKLDEAGALADRLTALQPDNPTAWRLWYAVMKARGKTQEALQKVQSVCAQHEEDAGFLFLIVDIYNTEELFDQSLALLRPALDAHPDSAALYLKLVDTLWLRMMKTTGGKVDAAAVTAMESILLDGLEKTDDHWALQLKVAELCERTRRWNEAESWVRKVLETRPRYGAAWVRLGVVLLQQKKTDEAMDAFNKGVTLDPTQFVAWNNMAWIVATQKGDLARAKVYIGTALNLAPEHPDLLDTAGWIQYLDSDYRGAVDLLERSWAKNPEAHTTRYHLGMAYKGQLKSLTRPADRTRTAQQAVDHLKAFLATAPTGPEAKEAADALKDLETTLKEPGNGS